MENLTPLQQSVVDAAEQAMLEDFSWYKKGMVETYAIWHDEEIEQDFDSAVDVLIATTVHASFFYDY